MKKYFTFGLIMSLISGTCFAEHPMIMQLIQEKQQKMEKLEKCKGTTKSLKIAGISTLGITAVGIGANIAEAVVLDKTKDQVKEARDARDVQLEIKESRQALERFCNEIGGDLISAGTSCVRYVYDIDEYKGLVSTMRQKLYNCKTVANPLGEKCSIAENGTGAVSVYMQVQNDQNDKNKGSEQGDKEKDSGQDGKEQPVDPGDVYKYKQENYTCTQKVKAVFDEVYDAVEKCKKQNNIADDDIMNIMYIMDTLNQYEEILEDKKIRRIYTLPNLYCDAGFSIDKDMGECEPNAEQEKPQTLEQKCKKRHPNGTAERLACCYAGGATTWDNKTNTCSCRELSQQWQGGKCVPKLDNGNKGGQGKNDQGGAETKPDNGAFARQLCRDNGGILSDALECSLKFDIPHKYNAVIKQLEDKKFKCYTDKMVACNDGKYVFYIELQQHTADENCPAPAYKYDGQCVNDDGLLKKYCDGQQKASRSYAAGRSICHINFSDERYATEQEGIDRAKQWAAHIPEMTDCTATVNWGDDYVNCTVGPVRFQFQFDALDAKPKQEQEPAAPDPYGGMTGLHGSAATNAVNKNTAAPAITGLWGTRVDLAKQLCPELQAAGNGFHFCDVDTTKCQQLNSNNQGLHFTYSELGAFGTHCWVY